MTRRSKPKTAPKIWNSGAKIVMSNRAPKTPIRVSPAVRAVVALVHEGKGGRPLMRPAKDSESPEAQQRIAKAVLKRARREARNKALSTGGR